ncbi:N-acetylneuraminate synthase family protein [Prosthecochloris vibrioformis]|uniref:Polyhydroxyalkanoate biosynthesis repressor PhaR n=1 Tax=Prosthecochloris vibrioformis TaxID=1098 RepID=A0A5C4S1G7_PROVB|nr:N-acetylneuraminate synthase family protein [Prosthecochloris vibrioformis]TNJ36601.1 polyhydroxyalkanoate biosynthesis repressor PhaR [Prosthecochloris vibrioformis]
MAELNIAGRLIGEEHPPVVIAEIGINHNGSLDVAIAMADAAIDAGAEIIKHQTHIIEDEMSQEARSVIPGNADISIYNIMESCALSENDERALMHHVENRGAIFISTPFSRAAADRLARFDIPAFKIGSGECNNYPLIRHIAGFGKPVILSTGMNTLDSIRPSVDILRSAGLPFALLHCTNVYPTPPRLVRLDAIRQLKETFPDAVVGLSDHTTTNYPCLGAVALGASILERHFTNSMERQGPDIVCSMDPKALSELITGSNILFEARGGQKGPVDEEAPTIAFAFASVVAIRDIAPGEKLSPENIWLKRPGGGDFGVNDYENLFGKTATSLIKQGYQVKADQVTE